MIRNFFTTALRNIRKHKAYSTINFVGLTCGLALALLIFTYIRSEVSYDRFHTRLDRLYRINYTVPNGLLLASTPPPIVPRLTEFFPEVETAARLYLRSVTIGRPNTADVFEESRILFADSAIRDMMTFEWVRGNPANMLGQKFTVLINEEMATKYFGSDDPIGETLLLSGNHPFQVVGVVRDFPENSHLRFNMLVPYDDMFDLEDSRTEDVLRNNLSRNFIISHSYSYVLLKPGASPETVNARLEEFVKKYSEPVFQVGQKFSLMPVVDIHLKSNQQAEPSPTNSISTLMIFAGIGLLTLLIACINYVNLSTAQSMSRVREIGIRKVLGSQRIQLVTQFLTESFLFALVSLLLAFLLFYFTLPMLNELTNKELVFQKVVDAPLILSAGVLLVIITLMAGGYPAYFVSQFESITAIKGDGTGLGSRQWLRKALVVFQLTIACMLLSGSLLIVKQLHYLQDRPLGFHKEHVITIPLFSQNINGYFRQRDTTFQSRLQAFRDAVEGEAGVQATTLSAGPPGLGGVYRGIVPEGFTREDNLFVANMPVDYDFFNTYEIEMVAGRALSADYPSDATSGFLVNETAVKEFNWGNPADALGKAIDREGKKGEVIGVVRDFNFVSLTTPVSALVMDYGPQQFNTLSVRFDNENVQSTLDKLQRQWNSIFPEKAFEFTFLDEQLNSQYTTYQNFGRTIQMFAIIAILIACLGVYGLVLFTVQRKVKEIGVRKVLGARVESILALIYRDFAWLLLLGFILALPVSYYFINRWLENFVYRATPDWLTYTVSLLVIGTIVTLTVSYQAVVAARANPVKSLRSE